MAQPARLLVVEGDGSARAELCQKLSSNGYAVELAGSGQQALELVAAHDFDLVLLDGALEGMSGLEVIERIRLLRSACELPVILLETHPDSSNVVAALHRGANDYITLPLNFTVALARIENRLALAAADRELRGARDLYRLASQASDEGLWDWDLATHHVHYSARWKSMLGYSGEDISADVDEWRTRMHPDDHERVWAEIEACIEGRTGRFECEYRLRHKNGRYRWMENRAGVSRDLVGRATRIAGCQADITAHKTIDPLTSLLNRVGLVDELRTSCEPSSDGGLAALLLFELDGFERVEASLPGGGAARLLLEVARRLREVSGALMEVDAVTARPADHQFAVLLRDVASVKEAREIAGRTQAALGTPLPLEGQMMFITVSLGIAVGPCTPPGESLLGDATAALRHARKSGRGNTAVFQPAMRDRDLKELRLLNDLRAAVERSEFMVHYQPDVLLASREIEGFEALVRWQRPGFGLAMPAAFIPAAERTGLIVPIGRIVLERACLDTAELRRTFPNVGVSVNVSARQLAEPNLVEQVLECLDATGLPPSALRLEITETIIMENPEHALGLLRRFRQMGVKLQLDDFGAGYSSLAYLQQFPFDALKIDRSFVSRLGDGPESVAIVRTIIALARSLNLAVIAEGIETEAQLEILEAMGCGYGQGYWFSRPVNVAHLRELLARPGVSQPPEVADDELSTCQERLA